MLFRSSESEPADGSGREARDGATGQDARGATTDGLNGGGGSGGVCASVARAGAMVTH